MDCDGNMQESIHADKLQKNVTREDLINIFKEASTKLSENPDRCGTLLYTQKSKIREPEATHILALVISENKIHFGLEVPTKKKYKFTGESSKSASIDIAIEPDGKQVNVELKEGQNDTIQKDFEKLLIEDIEGGTFFHILQNSDSGTLPNLFEKYKKAYANLVDLKDKKSKWFILFIFIKEKKKCFWKTFDDIAKISLEDFDKNKFLEESLSKRIK